MNKPNEYTYETAKHAGSCFLCAGRIFAKDQIVLWYAFPVDLDSTVAAHVKCFEDNKWGES